MKIDVVNSEAAEQAHLAAVLGRLALWSGILSVSGLSGWLAQIYRQVLRGEWI